MGSYSELEATILGLVGKHGPCTAYEIMRLFQLSPTSSWRASSGAIYPAVKKLVRLDLLTTRPNPTGGRKASQLDLAPAGRAALVQWLVDEPDGLGDPSSDPIRSRLMFLGALPPDRQGPYVAQCLQRTEDSLAALTAVIAAIPTDEPFELFAHEGARAQLAARRDWLRTLLPRLPAGGE